MVRQDASRSKSSRRICRSSGTVYHSFRAGMDDPPVYHSLRRESIKTASSASPIGVQSVRPTWFEDTTPKDTAPQPNQDPQKQQLQPLHGLKLVVKEEVLILGSCCQDVSRFFFRRPFGFCTRCRCSQSDILNWRLFRAWQVVWDWQRRVCTRRSKSIVDDPAAFTREMTRILRDKHTHPLIAQMMKPAESSEPPSATASASGASSSRDLRTTPHEQFQ